MESNDISKIKPATNKEGELPDSDEKIKNRVFILKPGFDYNPWTKWPRNLACVCGSGLKFKNCHDGNLSHAIPRSQYVKAKMEFAKALGFVNSLKDRGIIYKRPPTETPDATEHKQADNVPTL